MVDERTDRRIDREGWVDGWTKETPGSIAGPRSALITLSFGAG